MTTFSNDSDRERRERLQYNDGFRMGQMSFSPQDHGHGYEDEPVTPFSAGFADGWNQEHAAAFVVTQLPLLKEDA